MIIRIGLFIILGVIVGLVLGAFALGLCYCLYIFFAFIITGELVPRSQVPDWVNLAARLVSGITWLLTVFVCIVTGWMKEL